MTPHYRTKARLQNKKNRKGITKKDQKTRQATNFRALQKTLKIQNARRKINIKQKQKIKPFKILTVITKAEKRRRRISGLKRKRKTTAKNRFTSQPNAGGVTRVRHIATACSANSRIELLHRGAKKL